MDETSDRPEADEHGETLRERRRERQDRDGEPETIEDAPAGDPEEEPAERRKRVQRPEREAPEGS